MTSPMSKWTQVLAGAAVVCGICGWAAVTSAVHAQEGSGLWAGVYADAQAKRGEGIANKACVACHGSELAGGEAGPALSGLEFIGNWSGLSLGDLFDRIISTMPADAPRSLSPQDTIDIISYVLKLNKFPAGQKDLSTDATALGGLKIDSTPPPK